MVSSTDAAYNLTVNNAASGSYALKVMTIVAVVFFPLVLLYQGWTFRVFRARVKAPPEPGESAPPPPPARADVRPRPPLRPRRRPKRAGRARRARRHRRARAATAARSARRGAAGRACAPRSTTRPASSSTISSIVLEARQPVRDQQRAAAARDASASATSASAVAVSRCSPGSSRISSGKPASAARASAIRRRWPPDMRLARSAAPRCRARPAGSRPSRAAGRRSSASAQLGLGWRRGGRAAGSRAACVSKTCASCATSPTTRAVRRRRRVARSRRRRASPIALVGRGSAAARRRASTCPRRSARPPRPAGPGARSRSTPSSAQRVRRSARAGPRTRSDVGPGRQRARTRGLAHRRGASSTACTRAALRAHALAAPAWPPGRPADELERRQRDERDDRQQHARRAARRDRGDAHDERAPQREPRAAASPARCPTPAVRARRRADRVSSASSRRACAELRRGQRAVDEQLGRALEQVDDRRGQLAARRACLASRVRRAACPSATARRSRPAAARASRIRPAAGSSHHEQRDRGRAGDQRDRERRHDAQQQVLQRVDVVHEPRQQIAARGTPAAPRGASGSSRR